MGILKNLNIVNLHRVKSMLKFKINVNLPRLLCIVVSATLNGEFERFGGLCVDCYYMTCYYVILSTLSVLLFILSTLSVWKFFICRLSVRPHPFEKFKKPFIHKKKKRSRLSVRPHPFEKFKEPFIRLTSSVRKS